VEAPAISDYLTWRLDSPQTLKSFLTIKTESVNQSQAEYKEGEVQFIQVMNQLVWNPKELNLNLGLFKIREAMPVDISAIVSIAENSFVHSRFHADKRFSYETAEKIKREWLTANLTTRSNIKNFVVVNSSGHVLGFVSLLLKREQILIDLISVLKEYRGLGLGKLLVLFCQQLAIESELPLVVGTQENNTANSLYRQLGFRLFRRIDVWHDLRNQQSDGI
jgi:ribosomal protein S18 acetylase RimI-like enzyme